jgi:hypothetical protein
VDGSEGTGKGLAIYRCEAGGQRRENAGTLAWGRSASSGVRLRAGWCRATRARWSAAFPFRCIARLASDGRTQTNALPCRCVYGCVHPSVDRLFLHTRTRGRCRERHPCCATSTSNIGTTMMRPRFALRSVIYQQSAKRRVRLRGSAKIYSIVVSICREFSGLFFC